jgi:hypothetical protein
MNEIDDVNDKNVRVQLNLNLWVSPKDKKELESEIRSAIQLRDWDYLADLIRQIDL